MGFNVSQEPPKSRPTWRASFTRRDARVWVLIALVASVLPSAASGQVHQIRATTAVCRNGQCVLAQRGGSAVAIGRFNPTYELLLTAGHIVAGKLQKVEIRVGDQWLAGQVQAFDSRLDLALVGIRSNVPLRSVCLAQQKPGDRTPAMAAGFPDGSQSVATPTGMVLALANPEVIRFGITTRQGMSGGALFDQDGTLLGIVTAHGIARPLANAFVATNDGTGYATAAPACRQFLQRSIGGIPDCRRPRPLPPMSPATEGETMPPTPPMPDTNAAELAVLRSKLAEMEAELAQLKSAPSDNAESAGTDREIIIVEGKTGPPGPPGPPGQSADPADLAAIRDRMENVADVVVVNAEAANARLVRLEQDADKNVTAVANLRNVVNSGLATAENRWDQTADMIATTALDVETLRGEFEKSRRVELDEFDRLRKQLAGLAKQNERQAATIEALERFTREHRVTVQILDQDGRVMRSEQFNINEPIQFRLTPRRAAETQTAAKSRIGF